MWKLKSKVDCRKQKLKAKAEFLRLESIGKHPGKWDSADSTLTRAASLQLPKDFRYISQNLLLQSCIYKFQPYYLISSHSKSITGGRLKKKNLHFFPLVCLLNLKSKLTKGFEVLVWNWSLINLSENKLFKQLQKRGSWFSHVQHNRLQGKLRATQEKKKTTIC